MADLRSEKEIFCSPPPDPEPRRLSVSCPSGQISLSYYDNRNSAARQTLLLIHGFMDSKRTWRYVWGHLSDRFRLVALDLPGAGESEVPNWTFVDRDRGLYAAGLLAEVVDAFVRKLQRPSAPPGKPLPKTLIAVGQSLGGAILLQMLTGTPEGADRWIRRAVLIDALEVSTPAFPLTLYDAELFRAAPSPLVAMGNWTPVGAALARGFLERVFFNPRRIPREFLESNLAYMREAKRVACTQRIYEGLLPRRADGRPDWTHRHQLLRRLLKIRKPVLLLWGAQDTLVPLAHGDLLARRIPGAGYCVLDTCGHAPQLERPEATAKLLARFAASPKSMASLGSGGIRGLRVEQRLRIPRRRNPG